MSDLADQIAQQYQAQMGFAPSAGVLDYFVNSIGNQGATFADLGNTLQAAGGQAYSGGTVPQSAGAGPGGTAVSSGGGGVVPPVVAPPPPTGGGSTGSSGLGWNDMSNQISNIYQQSMGKPIPAGTLAYFANDLASGRANWADLNNTLQAAGGKAFDPVSFGYGAAPTAADKAPSTPYLSDMVTQAYRQATGHDPSPGVLDYFVRDLASGKANWNDLNNTLTAYTGGKGFNPADFGYGSVPKFQAAPSKTTDRSALMAQLNSLKQQLAQLMAQIADLKAKIAAKKAAGGGAASALMTGAGGSGSSTTLGAPVTDTSGGPSLGGLATLAAGQQPTINGPQPMNYTLSNVAI